MPPGNPAFDRGDSDEEPSIEVVRAVAAYANERTTDLPPLTEAVDLDALDSVIDSLTEGHVSFTYADHRVTVTADRAVTVEPVDPVDPSDEVLGE